MESRQATDVLLLALHTYVIVHSLMQGDIVPGGGSLVTVEAAGQNGSVSYLISLLSHEVLSRNSLNLLGNGVSKQALLLGPLVGPQT